MEDKGPPEKPKNPDSLLIYNKIDDVRLEVKEDIKSLDTKFDNKFNLLDTKFDNKFNLLDKKLDDKFNLLDNKIYGAVFGFAVFAGGIVIKRYIRLKPNGKISTHLANNLK